MNNCRMGSCWTRAPFHEPSVPTPCVLGLPIFTELKLGERRSGRAPGMTLPAALMDTLAGNALCLPSPCSCFHSSFSLSVPHLCLWVRILPKEQVGQP